VCSSVSNGKEDRKIPKTGMKRIAQHPLIGMLENVVVQPGVTGVCLNEREAREDHGVEKGKQTDNQKNREIEDTRLRVMPIHKCLPWWRNRFAQKKTSV